MTDRLTIGAIALLIVLVLFRLLSKVAEDAAKERLRWLGNLFGCLIDKALQVTRLKELGSNVDHRLRRTARGESINDFIHRTMVGKATAFDLGSVAEAAKGKDPDPDACFIRGIVSWVDIEKSRCVTRQQQERIVTFLKTQRTGLQIICIKGVSNVGKSVLARAAILQFAHESRTDRHEPVILELHNSADPNSWHGLRALLTDIKRRLVVLADDPFISAPAIEAIRTLGQDLPITLVLTTQPGPLIESGFSSYPNLVELEIPFPSTSEKINFERLIVRAPNCDPALLQELIADPDTSFEVLYNCLSGGRGQQIISRQHDSIFKQSPESISAYQMVAFTWQFEVPMPKSLLRKIADGLELDTLVSFVGVIQSAGESGSELRIVGHPHFARAIVRDAESRGFNIAKCLRTISESLDLKEPHEREFFVQLFISMRLQSVPQRHFASLVRSQIFETLITQLKSIYDIAHASIFCRYVGESSLCLNCDDRLRILRPRTATELLYIWGRAHEAREGSELLSDFERFLGDDTAGDSLWPSYLVLLSEFHRDKLSHALERVRLWLQRHNNGYVRDAYMAALLKGTHRTDEYRRAIEDAMTWIDSPELGKRGMICASVVALALSANDATLKRRVLDLLPDWEKRGFLDEDENARLRIFKLFKAHGATTAIEWCRESMRRVVVTFDSANVIVSYLRQMIKDEPASKYYDVVRRAYERFPDNLAITELYLSVYARAELDDAAALYEQAIVRFHRHLPLRLVLSDFLRRSDPKRARAVLEAAPKKQASAPLLALAHGRIEFSEGRYAEARERFAQFAFGGYHHKEVRRRALCYLAAIDLIQGNSLTASKEIDLSMKFLPDDELSTRSRLLIISAWISLANDQVRRALEELKMSQALFDQPDQIQRAIAWEFPEEFARSLIARNRGQLELIAADNNDSGSSLAQMLLNWHNKPG